MKESAHTSRAWSAAAGLSARFSLAALQVLAAERAGQPLWIDDGGTRTWGDFVRLVDVARRVCRRHRLSAGEIAIVPGEMSFKALAWFFGAASEGLVVAPLGADRLHESQAWERFVRVDYRIERHRVVPRRRGFFSLNTARLFDVLKQRRGVGLILATSGTTGTAKVMLHDLSAMLGAIPVRAGRAWRTLPLMRFDHIGGLDMVWRALAGGQILVAPPPELTPEAVARTIARHRVEVLPATPSFLNLLLMADAPRHYDLSSLRIVPYGAEPMPAALLTRLRAALPEVEFTQRFGTSETGGLPVKATETGLVLEAARTDFAWKIIDGELWVRSPARALGYLSAQRAQLDDTGWFCTGDQAEELPDGSVRVLGRRDDLINVGGKKVTPATVESALLAHPNVADCRVTAAPSAVLGQVVAAEVVWRGESTDPLAVKRALHLFAASSLPRCHLPAVVRLVAAVETSRHFKKSRRPHS